MTHFFVCGKQTKKTVLFQDGTAGRFHVYVYGGACLKGDPTAYVMRDGRMVWVVAGESVEFVEAFGEMQWE
jgi:hypothetical protein